ncbi:hypothetical protein ACIQPR_08910 [Streptomyces sp. NPDC091280]|uniref:hypothetical protein n=1 Tax=Streptomyces sp. NPDC091280 TaxID=3365984 RepID=UPI00380291E5
MPIIIRATGEAKDRSLGESAQFVEDARQAVVPGDRTVRAALSYSGKTKELTVALAEDDD